MNLHLELAALNAAGNSHAAYWKFLTYISVFVLAMTLGVVAIGKRWRHVATVCGIVCFIYCAQSLARVRDGDEIIGMLVLGFIQLLMGVLFCWLPRPRKTEGAAS